MKQKIAYTDAPENIAIAITEGEIIADFLPHPSELSRKEANRAKVASEPDTDPIIGIGGITSRCSMPVART